MNTNKLKKKIRKLLKNNTMEGHSKLFDKDYSYIAPAPGNYPFQWFWDTAFNVFILCALEEYETAKKNMESLFAMQEDNGFVGHMIFWNRVLPQNYMNVLQAKPTIRNLRPHMSALIQPPFVAQATLRIYEETGDKKWLKNFLPKLFKYFEWLDVNRDFDNDGLITIITSFESGMDWKPSYDGVVGFGKHQANEDLYWKIISVDFRNFIHRYNLKKIYDKGYFLVKDAGLNSIYAWDLYALSVLSKEAGDEKSSKKYQDRYKKVVNQMLKIMFDEEDSAFYDVYGKKNKKSRVLTPTVMFPLVFEKVPKDIADRMINEHLLNQEEFDSPYPIPSVSLSEPSFNPYETMYLWRGPTWIVFNWFLYRCLLVRGYEEHAEKLLKSIFELIDKSGFREYYNPLSGEGYGATNFTWSGLVLDMLRTKDEHYKGKKLDA